MGKRLLLLFCSLGFVLLVAEFALRALAPQWTVDRVRDDNPPMFVASDVFLAELIPNTTGRNREREFDVEVRLNSAGYRQPEFAPEKAAQTRIVAIGDSFTFGHGVEGEQAYPRRLETELASRTEAAVEVINAGVPGRWVDEYYLELEERSLALAPDLVLVGLYIKNDLDGRDAESHLWPRVDEQGLPLQVRVPELRVDDGFLSRADRKLRWRLPVVRDSHVAQLFFDGLRAAGGLFKIYYPKNHLMYAPVYADRTQEALAKVRLLLVAMARSTREAGARFAVLLIPAREQVLPDRYPAPDGLDYDRPQQVVGEMLRAEGIPYLDLLPALRDRAGDTPLYFEADTHWTVAGHVLAARLIADYLIAEGLIAEARR